MNNFLDDFESCLSNECKITGSNKNYLIEDKTKTKVELKNTGRFIHVDFELIPGNRFPFFNNGVAKLCKVCDAVLFSEKKGVYWVFLIELKSAKGNGLQQLEATQSLIEYIVKNVSRVKNFEYKIEYRLITHVKSYRPPVSPSIKYDKNNHTILGGTSIQLPFLMQ